MPWWRRRRSSFERLSCRVWFTSFENAFAWSSGRNYSSLAAMGFALLLLCCVFWPQLAKVLIKLCFATSKLLGNRLKEELIQSPCSSESQGEYLWKLCFHSVLPQLNIFQMISLLLYFSASVLVQLLCKWKCDKKCDDKAYYFHTAWSARHAWLNTIALVHGAWWQRKGKKREREIVQILSEGQFSGDLTLGWQLHTTILLPPSVAMHDQRGYFQMQWHE